MNAEILEKICPIIGAFMRRWNDDLPNDEERNRLLKPLIPLVIGTANPALMERRGWMLVDWQVRVSAPAWLRLAKLEDEAKALEELAELKDTASAEAAQPTLERVKGKAAAARAAAWDAAWDALKDTKEKLQLSAQDLVRRMCELKELEAATSQPA